MFTDRDPWMTPIEMAAEAKVKPCTVLRALRAGGLRGIKVSRTGSRGGKLWRSRHSWFTAWLEGDTSDGDEGAADGRGQPRRRCA